MENKGLILFPFISFFTNFVNSVEPGQRQHIIHELLDVILAANQLDLNVSEIEGDAILFFNFGESPYVSLTYEQAERMFLSFYKHLERYGSNCTCHFNVCISVINLPPKPITHYGEFKEYKIRNFRKLTGKDIIIAHQLVKNDIHNHEYLLIISSYLLVNSSNAAPNGLLIPSPFHSGAPGTEVAFNISSFVLPAFISPSTN